MVMEKNTIKIKKNALIKKENKNIVSDKTY